MRTYRITRLRDCAAAVFLLIFLMISAGCSAVQTEPPTSPAATQVRPDGLAPLVLPDLQPADLEGDRLHVVATTSIIGDIVSQIGGEAIELTVLMGPGQDPHGYEPSAGDLRSVAEADVIFVNGWDLEEGLVDDLRQVAPGVPLIPVSAGIPPLRIGGAEEKHPVRADPHTWLDPNNAVQWVENIEQVLVVLGGVVVNDYAKNAGDYTSELEELIAYYSEQANSIPADRRKLVTNHDTLAYFAESYEFEVVGVVIPGGSTLGEPSAGDLVQLLERMRQEDACAIFVETTANDQLASTLAAELDACPSVAVVPLYTGALGAADGPARNYVGMMRANIDAIVEALR